MEQSTRVTGDIVRIAAARCCSYSVQWQMRWRQTPDWFKDMMKQKLKNTGKKSAEKARKFQAKLAAASRGDDFEDGTTHISC